MESKEATHRLLCQEYVDLLGSPPNGWGQHVHPIYGASHSMLWYLYRNFGQDKTESILNEMFEKGGGVYGKD